ncbi:RagB/SusD family nutrient uptake outer membrane protein [Flavobacterium sp. GA093]|uniref:RagB/SusD family nutrient uptake outer membrane protein n=1 Tax=Flavobacterium hydrocarbonoxydans TaxID=2683249 RepID=A0A6I4NSJ4_9FLAO|nr:RagB/SusD family nutrient uptake outer membrane protein [Flavobacterium hydrocarbonoxydans]MWB94094.1 RagB/SusD family nutrient uptake outer membrane protein [Flavobacterium hydrocarbonoxydans]
MKNIYFKLIFLFLGLLLSTSCSDYLDKESDTELTLNGVFESKTKTENWLAGCYSRIPDPTWGYTRSLGWEILGDDMTPSERWRQYDWQVIPFVLGDWSVGSQWSPGYWNNLPQRIRECNLLIKNIKPLPEQNLTEDDVRLMIAECRFLKAYYYTLLINTYGPVPFSPDEITPVDYNLSDLQVGQTPYDEIVSWINNELKEVEEILPASYADGRKYGRATSIMCKAVRARMLLFAASPLVNGNQDYAGHVSKEGTPLFNASYDANKWKIAADASKDLIVSAEAAGHKLYVELNTDGGIDPFLSCQNLHLIEASKGNKEVLFARPSVESGEYDRHTAPGGAGGAGGYGVTQSLVDAFFTANGLPITDSQSGYVETGFSGEDGYWTNGATKWNEVKSPGLVTLSGTYNMYCNREPRFYLAVNFDGAWYTDGDNAGKDKGRKLEFFNGRKDNNNTHDAPQNGYLARKRTDPTRNPVLGYFAPRHGILYRLGEAYLNYAEALNESNPGNADILIYINKIRERAGVRTYTTGASDALHIHVDNDQESIRKIIRMERRVELCTEGIRYDDLRRWKLAETVLNGPFYGMNFNGKNAAEFYNRTAYQTRVYKKEFYWFPIYLAEIEKNPNLVQAPFWDK